MTAELTYPKLRPDIEKLVKEALKKLNNEEEISEAEKTLLIEEGMITQDIDGEVQFLDRAEELLLDLGEEKEYFEPDSMKDLNEIKAMKFEPITWLVEEWIPEGSITIIAGKGGSLKSYLAQYLVFCLSNGLDWLGFKVKKVNKIMILDMENSLELIQERFLFLEKGYGKEAENIIYNTPEKFSFSDDDSYESLKLDLEIKEVDVFVIDSLVRIAGVDENNAQEVSKLYIEKLKPLLKVVKNIIIIAHMRKALNENTDMSDLVRGSSDIYNMSDVVLGTRKNQRVKGKFYLYHLKTRRRDTHNPLTIDFKADNPQTYTKFEVSEEDIAESLTLECYEDIKAWIKEDDIKEFKSGTKGDLKRFMKPEGRFNSNIIDKARKLLEKDGIILRKGKGVYDVC